MSFQGSFIHIINNINQIITQNEITHIISCGYQMSNMIDNNPVKGAQVNIVGMTNLFECINLLFFP